MPNRCDWAEGHELSTIYHDTEWGVPIHDDKILFEFLTLEGAQAGLNWLTVLKKREEYRNAFAGFDPAKVSRFSEAKVARLLKNPGIIRHEGKIRSAISNAKCFIEVQKEFGSFDKYVWQFVGGKPLDGRRKTMRDIPAQTSQSQAMSKDLQKRGFRFVGPTICYAFMQAVGMVNDHITSCYRHREVAKR